MIGKLAKKLRRVPETKERDEEVVEEELEELEIKNEESGEEKREEEQEEGETKIIERLNEIDNRLPRLDIALNNLKKEINEIRNEMSRMDGNIQDIMMLYEVVSSQVNPFIGISKVTAVSMEKLERLEKNFERLSSMMDDLLIDMRIITGKTFDVDEIINEVLMEEI
jgi:flagellar protein FlaC